ncbi:MAG: 50S ribosomal protein L1 [Deltaproteobacteria bacterium]|nr:50S ribosomal protein L1 [Deltaproteobacteria bacterium]
MARRGKRWEEGHRLVNYDSLYSIEDACSLLKKFPKAKFDESVDIAVKLGVDPRKAEENVRGTVVLPHGTGKTLRVVAFCKGEKAKEALDAGADAVGADDLVKKIQDGWLEFDSAVATPDAMGLVGRIGKILGPRGLMPNPKVGTVTFDIGKAVAAIKGGQVEYRTEKAGVVQVGVGRSSFEAAQLVENITSLIDAVNKSKPKTSKGTYILSAHLSTTMSPGVPLDPAPLRKY